MSRAKPIKFVSNIDCYCGFVRDGSVRLRDYLFWSGKRQVKYIIMTLGVLFLVSCATAVEMGMVYQAWQHVPEVSDE